MRETAICASPTARRVKVRATSWSCLAGSHAVRSFLSCRPFKMVITVLLNGGEDRLGVLGVGAREGG
jgi:hypothetical protein